LRRLALLAAVSPGLLPLGLAGCGDGYSPNTYAANAAQVEATVQRGAIIGVRQIIISPDGTVGAAAGGAVGGVAGAQVAGAPVATALGAIGGTLVGGIGGAAAAQAVGKTKGWEYIVQEEPGDKLVSVTQTSKASLPIGLHVLVIAGTQQARIVPDYTVQVAAAPPPTPATAKPTSSAAPDVSNAEVRIDPMLPDNGAPASAPAGTLASAPAGTPDPIQGAPTSATTTPDTPPAPAANSAAATTPEAASNPASPTVQVAATAPPHESPSTTAKP
jgi:outer membrane lipoprotein SlyB